MCAANQEKEKWYTFFGSGACENCTSPSEGSCQVVEGRESEKECPVFQELVDFEEIRLLGPYWKKRIMNNVKIASQWQLGKTSKFINF